MDKVIVLKLVHMEIPAFAVLWFIICVILANVCLGMKDLRGIVGTAAFTIAAYAVPSVALIVWLVLQFTH